MLRRLVVLDAALVALIAFGGLKLHRDWSAFGPAHDAAAIRPEPQSFPSLAVGTMVRQPAGEDWTEIPAHNPFSFDRTDIEIVAAAPAPAVETGPKPVLYGTVFLNAQQRYAMVAPGPTGMNYKPMRVGEAIDGWTIVELESKSIVVESNGVRQSVIMNDPSLKIPRDSARTAAAASPVSTVIRNVPPSAPAAATAGRAPAATAPTATSSPITNPVELFGAPKQR